jgi:hypothetical protein
MALLETATTITKNMIHVVNNPNMEPTWDGEKYKSVQLDLLQMP